MRNGRQTSLETVEVAVHAVGRRVTRDEASGPGATGANLLKPITNVASSIRIQLKHRCSMGECKR